MLFSLFNKMFKNENLPKVTLLYCSSYTLLHVRSHPPSQRQVWNSHMQDMAREASEISSYYYKEIYNPESNTLNHWNKIINTIIPKYYFRNTNYIYLWNMKKMVRGNPLLTKQLLWSTLIIIVEYLQLD